ncbi:hypothetical protein KIH23_01055 [Flavobacterium sp. CYK-55]|uniref:hypothetical protein n=1 Tax=Flavobacterium sp. CYK-55 TaxID=2835529 RepID=UPI001BCFB150|nr:hypothetical protein [Flavobacterium sp. CYK-55]MBS7785871.1 hypothetical protein [Flavobacterium sp. CYK-55]
MKNKDLMIGVLLALLTTFLGTFLFIKLFTDMGYLTGMHLYKEQGMLGKILTLGAILNIILFYFLIKKDREEISQGVILGLIIITVVTLFL